MFHPINTAAEHAEIESPSTEKKARHLGDMMLRAAEFAIVSRPNRGKNIWQRSGVQYPEDEALLRAPQIIEARQH